MACPTRPAIELASEWRAASVASAPGGGSLRGKVIRNQSTIETARMIVPARRRKAHALSHTWEAIIRGVGSR